MLGPGRGQQDLKDVLKEFNDFQPKRGSDYIQVETGQIYRDLGTSLVHFQWESGT